MEGGSDGLDEAYRPPQADDSERDGQDIEADETPFYVVSIPKLVVLYFATLGTYEVYWFYRHWRAQRRAFGIDVMPWARALFSVLFVGRLFKAIDGRAREADHEPTWDAGGQAGIYVAVVIGSRLVSRIADGLLGTLVGIVIGLAAVVPLIAAQKVANLASDDADGRSNAGFDAGSVLVVLLCWAFSGLVIFITAGMERLF